MSLKPITSILLRPCQDTEKPPKERSVTTKQVLDSHCHKPRDVWITTTFRGQSRFSPLSFQKRCVHSDTLILDFWCVTKKKLMSIAFSHPVCRLLQHRWGTNREISEVNWMDGCVRIISCAWQSHGCVALRRRSSITNSKLPHLSNWAFGVITY